MNPRRLRDCLVIGELGLDGGVRKVPGILPIVMEAKSGGVTCCIVPAENAAEGALVEGMKIIGVESLQDVVAFLNGRKENGVRICGKRSSSEALPPEEDFADLRGQENVRRAAEIAVAGGTIFCSSGRPAAGRP